MNNNLKDEILELLWSLRETGSKSYKDVVEGIDNNDTADVMRKMEKAGIIKIAGDDVELTEKGPLLCS